LLVSEDWLGRDTRPRFADDAAVRAMLNAIPVNAVLIDHAIEAWQARPYHQQIERLLKADPEHWQHRASYRITRYGQTDPRPADLYLRRTPRTRPADLAYTRQLL
jgi:hypothetical protein